MKYLTAYVAQRNRYATLFGNKVMDATNLSMDDMLKLADSLECDLSPENLCCDGELRGAALTQKSTMLYGARSELEALM